MKHFITEKLSSGAFQNIGFFEGISPSKVHPLLLGATKQLATHRQFIINEGEEADFFVIVLSGAFKLLKKIKQHSAVFDFAVENDLIGALLMSGDNTFPISVAAIGTSGYLRIPRETYQQAWTSDPEIVNRVQKATLRRMEALQFGRMLQGLSTEKKMAGYLLRLAANANANAPAGVSIDLTLTRKDLAEAIGTRTETAIRIISTWQKNGFIKITNRGLHILQPAALVKIYQE